MVFIRERLGAYIHGAALSGSGGRAIEEIENDLLVRIPRQVQHDLPVGLTLRVLGADRDLL